MKSNFEIFFSYAWSNESEQGENRESLVNQLYESLLNDNYNVIRDKYNLAYKGFISEFMNRIGKAKCIIIAISKKYLESPYCMFELYEIARYSNFDKRDFRDKIIPIMVEFIDLANPEKIEHLFSFWENEYNKWNDLVKTRSGQLAVDQMQRYDKIKMIYHNFGKLAEWIADINTLNIEMLSANNYSEIKKEIERIFEEQTQDLPKTRAKSSLAKTLLFWIIPIVVITLTGLWLSRSWRHLSAEPVFRVVQPANEQLLVVQNLKTKLLGYARAKDTSIFISYKYDEANSFKDGFALVKLHNKYQWIKPDSTTTSWGEFDYARYIESGKAKVAKGKDTFFINISTKGVEKKDEPGDITQTRVSEGVSRNPKEKTVTQPENNDQNVLQPIRMCSAMCDAKGITGVELSFTDTKADTTYTLVSNGKNLKFPVPCYLLEQPIRVTFKKDGQSDYRNVKLNDFEIPENFKN